MDEKRRLELLAYARVCFDNCTNPFELIHLQKKNVTAGECRDLSRDIADAIEEDLNIPYTREEIAQALENAEKEFDETQK